MPHTAYEPFQATTLPPYRLGRVLVGKTGPSRTYYGLTVDPPRRILLDRELFRKEDLDEGVNAGVVCEGDKVRTKYSRVIVQMVNAEEKIFRIVEDLGPVTTVKANSIKRKLGKTLPDLAVVYWVG